MIDLLYCLASQCVFTVALFSLKITKQYKSSPKTKNKSGEKDIRNH